MQKVSTVKKRLVFVGHIVSSVLASANPSKIQIRFLDSRHKNLVVLLL